MLGALVVGVRLEDVGLADELVQVVAPAPPGFGDGGSERHCGDER